MSLSSGTMTANDNNHRGGPAAGRAGRPAAAGNAGAGGAARRSTSPSSAFAAFGYERVKPPLVEFEESPAGRPGRCAGAADLPVLMDPVSQRMNGACGPDMNRAGRPHRRDPAEARAAGRCACPMAATSIRVRGTALKPERQFAQVGQRADRRGFGPTPMPRPLLLAVDALARRRRGRPQRRTSTCRPWWRPSAAGLKLSAETLRRVRSGARPQRTRAASPRALGEGKGDGQGGQQQEARRFAGRPVARGRPGRARHRPGLNRAQAARRSGRPRRHGFAEVVKLVRAGRRGPADDASIPVEYRGLEYQTGRCRSRCSGLKGREELARGGRLFGGLSRGRGQRTGDPVFTLYMERGPVGGPTRRPSGPRLFLPPGTPWERGPPPGRPKAYAVVRGVTASADPRTEAKRLALQPPPSDRQGSRAANRRAGSLFGLGPSSAGRLSAAGKRCAVRSAEAPPSAPRRAARPCRISRTSSPSFICSASALMSWMAVPELVQAGGLLLR